MDIKPNYLAKRLGMIPDGLSVWAAAEFNGRLYIGLSNKSITIKPEGVLVVDLENQSIEHKFKEELGQVCFVQEMNNLLVMGGTKGLCVWPKDERHLFFPVKGGVNTATLADEDTIIIAGDSFVGFYRHSKRQIEPYSFGVDDILYVKEIHAVTVIPECYVIGRDISPVAEFTPALGFLSKDIQTKRDETERIFKTCSKEEIEEMITTPSFEQQKAKFPAIAPLIDYFIHRRPIYVRDLFYWKGWLLVIEYNDSYAINASDGNVIKFSHGGFLVAQNSQNHNEFWIGTGGNGVIIIRFDEKANIWTEDKDTLREVNIAISNACMSSKRGQGFYITCVCFLKDKVLVGTETDGAFLIERDIVRELEILYEKAEAEYKADPSPENEKKAADLRERLREAAYERLKREHEEFRKKIKMRIKSDEFMKGKRNPDDIEKYLYYQHQIFYSVS